MFSRHGLRVSVEKMEVMWVVPGRTELEIYLDGKTLMQRESFVYLGGAICGDGNSDNKIHSRMTVGANVLRKVKGVMGDRWISHTLKGKVLTLCVTSAYM